jgi:hemoglobin/transferrin/lactoferrin receptor protein
MNIKPLILIFWITNTFVLSISAQPDTLKYRLNRLTVDNVVEHKNIGDITVVSASRSARKIEDLPVTIHVVTRDEILLNNYITLVDVLKSLPSIKVSQPGSAENGEMFMMRGLLGNQYTKILVDNIPLKPSVTVGLPIEANFPIRQAERIEIIYGPASAIYGADAAIGVINIITKKSSSSVFSSADMLTGDYGYKFTNFHVGGKAGRNKRIFEYSFYGNFSEIRTLDIFRDSTVFHPLSFLEQQGMLVNAGGKTYLPTQIDDKFLRKYGIPMESFFMGMPNYRGTISMPNTSSIPAESNLFGFNLTYKKWNVSLVNMYRKTHSSIGRSPYLYKYDSPQYYLADRNNKFSINYNGNIRKINSNTNLILSSYDLDENSSFGVNFIPNFERAYQKAFSYEVFLEQLFTYNYRYLEIIGGLSTQFSNNLPQTNYLEKPYNPDYELYSSTEISINTTDYSKFGINPYAFIFVSGFVQFYLDLNKLKVVGGIRQEFNTLFPEKILNPRLAVQYAFNSNHSLRLSTGKAYKPPSGNILFQSVAFPFNIDGLSDSIYYATIPNPQLLPEYFQTHEFGYRGNFLNKKLSLDFALYYNSVKNLIVTSYVDPRTIYSNAYIPIEGEFARLFVNTKDATTQFYGIDFAVIFNNIYSPKNVRLQLSGSFTNGKETLPSKEKIPYLRGIPKYMFKINISGNPTFRTYINIENTVMSGWKRSFLPTKDYYQNSDYQNIKGYFITDIVLGYRIHSNLNFNFKVINAFASNYGGIDATSLDIDLRYNPQLGRNFRFGLSFTMN